MPRENLQFPQVTPDDEVLNKQLSNLVDQMADNPTPSQKVPQSVANSTHAQSILNDNTLSQQEQEDHLQRLMDALEVKNKEHEAKEKADAQAYLNDLFRKWEQQRLQRQHFNSSPYVANTQHNSRLTQSEKEERLQRVWDTLGSSKLSEKSTGRTRESYYNTRSSDMHSFYRELTDQPDTVKKHFDDLEYQDSNPPYKGPVTVPAVDPLLGVDKYWEPELSRYQDSTTEQNCYSYSISDVKSDGTVDSYQYMPWPGMYSGVKYSEVLSKRDKTERGDMHITEYIHYLEENVLRDLHEKHGNGRKIYSLADVKPGESIAVLSLNPGDKTDSYHFYKRSSDYLWSEKAGDSLPQPIMNPYLTYSIDAFMENYGAPDNYVPVAIFAYHDNS